MKPTTPRPFSTNARTFTSLFISFLMLVTPLVPMVSARSRPADSGNSNYKNSGAIQPGAPLTPPATTIVSATKTDSFPDPNNDGKAEEGDTITYDVNISNTGASDATGVTFTDTIDSNTTLVPGSLRVSPLAFADSYNATQDTPLSISAPGVLANDTGTPAPTASPIAGGATTQGGTVTLNSDGSFNYTPASGFTGTDTFTYTVTNGLTPDDNATVTINVDAGPVVTTTTPTNGAVDVASNTNITINFSEPVNATTGSFSIECPTGSPQSFNLSASPAASFTLDPVGDLPAGQTCTVTVIANQITDADSFDPPDQMAANYVFSFGVKLEAVDDMHSVTGNVRIDTTGSGFSVLTNDSPGVTISAFDSTSAKGGNVTMNTSTGTFTYDPPRGFTGTDSFNYTITNGAGSDTATVVLTVSDMIWFINNSAGACAPASCGRLTSPYNSLSDFEAVNGNGTVSFGAVVDPEAGDNIFIYTGSGSYTGPLTLENSQRVIGQGASSSIETLAVITLAPDSNALPSTGGTNPVITNPAGGGISLAQNNALHGLTVQNTTGTGVSGNGFGTLTVSENVILTNTTTAGTPISLNNGDLAATFRSISAGNNDGNPDPANGIVLTNTTGSFTVVGDGTNTSLGGNASGGTIQRTVGSDGTTAGIGVYLENATNVTLRRMQINDHPNLGVYGQLVNGFTMQYSTINGANGTSSGSNDASLALGKNNPGGVNGLSGTSLIDNCRISGGIEHNMEFYQQSGSFNLTISNSEIKSNSTTLGSDGVQIELQGTATGTVAIQNSTLNDNKSQAIQASALGNSALDITVNACTITRTTQGNEGIVLQNASNADLTVHVTNNNFSGILGTNLFVGQAATNATAASNLVAFIKNNTITQGNATTFPTNRALIVFMSSTVGQQSVANILLDGNTINTFSDPVNGLAEPFFVSTPDANTAPNFTATVINNVVNINDPAQTSLRGMVIQATQGNGVANSAACLDVRGNTVTYSAGAPAGITGIRVRQAGSATVNLEQGASSGTAAAVLAANNPGSTTQVLGTVTVVPNNTCANPPTAMLDIKNEQREYLAQTQQSSLKQVTGQSSAHGRSSKATARSAARNTAKPAVISAAPVAPSGETVNATIGTLPAGKTVRVQFQVTVNAPLPSGVTQVSNQGTVSGDNFTTVQTDDPAAGDSADPTVTPILTKPNITIKDASVAEPSTGSAPATFTVTLSHAFSQTVTVNFATANDTGGANPATAGTDYTTTSGTLTFNAGEVVQTISVPVLADGDNSETAETFLVNISTATNGVITDSQALGTINPNGTPGTVLISELRTSGPLGPDDDFVELLNNTDSAITVSDASGGWALVKSGGSCSDTPVVIAVIPNGTVIPARGNYLLTGTTYSLGLYATGDQMLAANIENDRNVALFNTADLSNLQTGTRLDAVGFGTNTGNNCDLLREGGTLLPASGSTSEYSFVRSVDKGETIDAGNNATDFIVVSTTPATAVGSNATPTLGAPGPESSTSPRGPVPCNAPGTAKFDRARLDSSVGVGASPNTVRDNTSDPVNNSTYGTLDVRRRFTNNTGGSVTRLRFRIVDMSTEPNAPGTADLRARTSTATLVPGVNDPVTCNGSAPCNVTVNGTTLEMPPAQLLGGGVNSSLGAGTITLATPLNSGASVNLRFLFGVEQEGNYRIGIVIETLTGGSTGQDIWQLRGNTINGGHTDGGCNTPPVANAGADKSVECAGAGTSVTLDGTASSDPDGDTPLTYEWREGVTVLGSTATLNTSLTFGSHTITLKVTDPSGDFSEDTVIINVVDSSDPDITPPPNVTVYTGPGATTCGTVVDDATLGTATASDGCSATVNITRSDVPAGNNFPVGQTIITYTADDGHGNTKEAYQTVTVIDNTAPTLSVPPNQTVDAPANSCSANVDPGTATANDNCPGVTVTGVRSDSQPLNAPYPVGVTTITWTAKDAVNNTTTGIQTITVKDAQAPTIVLTTGTLTLSPPNHQYQTFTIAQLVASASDVCDASVDINDVVISQVTSDEVENASGNGDGNTQNDIVITPDCKSLQLRKERAGGGDGRVYTITLMVEDSSGNVTTAVRKVFVPQTGPVIDSGAQYTVNGCTP